MNERIHRVPTRRTLLAAGVAFPSVIASSRLAVAAPATDRELLALLATLEQIQIDLYSAILAKFDDAEFEKAGYAADMRDRLTAIHFAEHAQLELLSSAPSMKTAPEASTDLSTALADAMALENLATSAYAGAIPRLGRRGLIEELIGIQSVEARHATWLATVLEVEPVAGPVDSALPPTAVLEALSAIPGQSNPTASPAAEDAELSAAISAIAAELGLPAEGLQITSVEPRDWPDASLGCPREGEMYAQVITPGYDVVVAVDGAEMRYHTDRQGNVVHCP